MADSRHILETNKVVLRNFKIQGKFPSENIQEAVTQLLSIGEIHYNLYCTLDCQGINLSDNTVCNLLITLTTTSVNDFNKTSDDILQRPKMLTPPF